MYQVIGILFFSILINVFLFSQSVNCQPRISEVEASYVLAAFTNGGGLDLMRKVLDNVRRLDSQSNVKQAQLERVFKRRLNYGPSMDLDSLDLEHELIDETEKLMSTVLYHLYDEWEEMIKPMRLAFDFDLIAKHNPSYFMHSPGGFNKMEAPTTISKPVNETVIEMINGLPSIPMVLTSANDLLDKAIKSIESGKLNYVDRETLQDKIIEKLSKISDQYNFL